MKKKKKRRVYKKYPLWQWNVVLTITCYPVSKNLPFAFQAYGRGLSNAFWITERISSFCISLQGNKHFWNSSSFLKKQINSLKAQWRVEWAISFFIIFTFRILMALDSEIIPVKRKINILIYLPLQQIEISRISSREENVLVLTIFMNIYHPYPSDYCFVCANTHTQTHTHTHTVIVT